MDPVSEEYANYQGDLRVAIAKNLDIYKVEYYYHGASKRLFNKDNTLTKMGEKVFGDT